MVMLCDGGRVQVSAWGAGKGTSMSKAPQGSTVRLGWGVGRWWDLSLVQSQCALVDTSCVPGLGDSSEQGPVDTAP